ncbi:MAG TPA: hypothetical protein DCS97_14855, partial [Planctomycetes bacterium]|nr:hypothetical protein [Planctomycetota bacterium]
MPRRILVPTLAACVAFLGACGGPRPAAATPEPASTPKQQAAEPVATTGLVATVTAVEGRTLVEFTLDGGAAAEPGTPYRVLSADGARIKGMIQVTDVPAKGRAVARVIALTDAADPPAPADRVRELTSLAEPAPTTPAAGGDAADEQRFATLREQYQRLLAEAVSRHDSELAEARRAADARIAEA